ncbi:secretory lipase [Jatrophihabitans sp. GAS493]|uniref:lipase family protein n=1 Tax=Jatrophihabitans sp. GAS493 TaxID=1907575 RepID=UPI000BB985F7|nr:lipase family protein [Jatrophihabitans sp. GAS493]SOD73228.1 secretory lipase [Jatrophihabitans sp. GAS493]
MTAGRVQIRNRKLSVGLAVATILVSAAGVGLNAGLNQVGAGADTAATFPVPANDPFYASPANLADLPNGKVIRSRTVPAKIAFLGLNVPLTAWQLAYRSNDAHDQPITSVTTLLVPTAKYTGKAASRPLIAYQTAEDSTGSQCAPSYTLETNSAVLTGQEQSLMAEALNKGFALDVADFEGPNSGFLVGRQAAHIALDGIRAALSFAPAGFNSSTPVGAWGYSGGGHATAWTAELQHSYAPDLKIAGIAFGGAPANLENSYKQLNGGPFVGFMLGAIVGVSHGYPEWNIKSQLNAKGLSVFAAVDQKCTADFVVNVAFTNVNDLTTVPNGIDLPQNQSIIALDNLGQNMPVAPIYDYYSLLDEAIPTADSVALIKKYCSAGVKVIAQPVALSEHVTLGIIKTPDVLSFLDDRFNGKPISGACKL